MGDTIQKPGGDSGVVRVHGTNKAIAATVDSSAVYCWAHPLSGGKQVVCESWRNLISVGATPIAITNCLNFGSPENEDNMGEFVECVQGIGEASKYLEFPVVSGNVSFYNQTKEIGIKPTPSIGGVGLIKDYSKMITMDFKEINNLILIIGKTEGHMDQSLFLRSILDEKNGPPPEINLFNEKNNGETLLQLIKNDFIKSAHDVSLGGILTAISKMCIKSNKGFEFNKPKFLMSEIEYFFSEDQGRYIVEINPKDLKKVTNILEKNSVHYDEIGKIVEKDLVINKKTKVTIDELKSYNTNWLKKVYELIMAMDLKEIEKHIKEALPDALVEIQDLAGDGNHYSATVTSSQFSGKSKIEQHKMVYNSLKGKMGNELHALAIKTKEQ